MVLDPHGGALIAFQRKAVIGTDLGAPNARAAPPGSSSAGSYGGATVMTETSPCTHGDLIHTTVTHVYASGFEPSAILPSTAALPVDLAVAPDRSAFTLASALTVGTSAQGNVVSLPLAQLGAAGCADAATATASDGRVVAAAYLADGGLVVQTVNPPALIVRDLNVYTYPLGPPTPEDTGFRLFHSSYMNPSADQGHVACASCHPEGGDDGQVWSFDGRPVRTQSLRGGVIADAPFHWDGAFPTFDMLVHATMPERMNSAVPDPAAVAALATWLDAIPRIPAAPAGDSASVSRGQQLFESERVGCANCHAGARRSTHAVVDVGTGGAFKVPSLVGVGSRGPWMHNGCAATLAQRFEPSCGGGDHHGQTSQLTPDQIADLVVYLQSL
jgi:mono/diheme cytochrome c family protein